MRNILIIVGLLATLLLMPFSTYQVESVDARSFVYLNSLDSCTFMIEMNQPYFPSIIKSIVIENNNVLVDITVYMNEFLRSFIATLKTNFNLLTIKYQSTFMVSSFV
ncbi:hypothetical protein [Halalkalibacter alkalisediminis]|uniref:Uncharacterized protein n=1 Tax=Halalkalibacter alkalisediminis TaxID=935616 RepID=A0ABV6NFW5_9BACI|nr:hypothetical protein [Halalkalibacter alkalisediminis]